MFNKYTFTIFSIFILINICFCVNYFNFPKKNLVNINSQSNNLVIFNKKNLVLNNFQDDLILNNILSNKKIISISPGGLKGFYLLGVLTYIKQNYNLENYIFTGASAGSWVSLFMSYKKSNLDLINKIFDDDLMKIKSLKKIQIIIKNRVLSNFNSDDFDLEKVFIGVSSLNLQKTNTFIYTDFLNLSDALDCCIASSHIPLITGGLFNFYKKKLSFDGGFSRYPYLNLSTNSYHIHSNIWNVNHYDNNNIVINIKNKNIFRRIKDVIQLILPSKKNHLELYFEGYDNSLNNKIFLDKIFTPLDK